MTTIRVLSVALLLTCAGGTAQADELPEMVTDRPDQTESTPLVTPGRVQVELGWTHTREDAGGGAIFSANEAPQTLIRIGLIADRVEGRIIHDGWGAESLKPGGSLDSGLNDGAVGFKFGLLNEMGAVPDVSLNVHTSVPVGKDGRSSDRFDPDFRFLFAHSLPMDFALSYNLGAFWAPTAVVQYTLSLGIPVAEQWGAYVEAFGDMPTAEGSDAAHLIDGGFTFAPRGNIQFDIEGGVGLSDAAEDWFAGIGVSVRFPD